MHKRVAPVYYWMSSFLCKCNRAIRKSLPCSQPTLPLSPFTLASRGCKICTQIEKWPNAAPSAMIYDVLLMWP